MERVEFHELRAGKNTSMDKDDLGHQVRYATLVFKDSSSLGPALQLDGQVRLEKSPNQKLTFIILDVCRYTNNRQTYKVLGYKT